MIKEIWEFLANDGFYHQKINKFLDFAYILYFQRDPKVHPLSLSPFSVNYQETLIIKETETNFIPF